MFHRRFRALTDRLPRPSLCLLQGGRVLKHLNNVEMFALIDPWVTNAKRKAAFLSIPEIAPLHAKLAHLREDLIGVRAATAGPSSALKALMAQAVRKDTTHDFIVRAVSQRLEAERLFCLSAEVPNEARAAQCEQAAQKLFPEGQAILNASYLAESGNTARVENLLKEEEAIPALLKSIPVATKTTLLDEVKRWVAVGAELGKLERAREEQEAKETAQPLTRASMATVRSRWLKLVSLVLTNLEESEAPAEVIETIRGPVMRAADRAGKRYEGGSEPSDNVVEDSDPTEPASPAPGKPGDK